MSNLVTTHAATAAEISLLTLCAAAACFLPPISARLLDNAAMVVLLGIVIAASLVLHLVFIGVLARAHDRSAHKYAALALFTLPIGSIVGLILLEWHQKVRTASRTREA